MKVLLKLVLVASCLALVTAAALLLSGSSPADRVNVRVAGYAFEPGAAVALELVPASGAACFGPSLWVEEVGLYDAAGTRVSAVRLDPQIVAGDWLGTVILRAADGSDLAQGQYEIRVTTSGGDFVASLDVVPPAQLAALGRLSPSAPVCDTALVLYRLVTELDADATVALRPGDRLLVLLAGNPTTGFSWSNTLADQSPALRESQEMEFRASSELLGAGGFFFFRYEALAAGRQDFRFVYQRPWESVEPIATLSFGTDVR